MAIVNWKEARGEVEPGVGPDTVEGTPEEVAAEVAAERGRPSIRGLLDALVALAAAGSLIAFVPRLWWPFELVAAFRVPLVGLLALAAIWLLLRRRWLLAPLVLALAVLNGLELKPLWERADSPPPAGVRNLRVVLFNVNSANGRTDEVVRWLRSAEPDVVVALEVTEPWADALEKGLGGMLPTRLVVPRPDNFGIAVMTRLRGRALTELDLGRAGVPSIDARLQVGVDTLRLVATHPMPPFGAEAARLRNEQLSALATELDRAEGPVLVVGDLNATPWSPAFEDLCRDADLHRLGDGYGLQATWISGLLPPWIPLDHVLGSDGVVAAGHEVGPHLGSDHRPIVVDVLLR